MEDVINNTSQDHPDEETGSPTPAEVNPGARMTFFHLLSNTLVASITNMTVWFALTFFIYLETKSVFATGMVSGIYLITIAFTGIWFGSLVDHYKKKHVMQLSGLVSLVIYASALGIYLLAPAGTFKNPGSITLWVFTTLLLFGVVAGNIRTIALPTTVTILFPPEHRDKANGLVGTTSGIAMLVVSVISGLLLGLAGMFWVLVAAGVLTVASILHLALISIKEKEIVRADNQAPKVDIRGTLAILSTIPGLFALIFFTMFNNFLGGVFMALMDAYGLSLVSVEIWGILWGILSLGFIIGGLVIAKRGLGKNPLKSLFLANICLWTISSIMTIQPSIILLAVGMFLYLCIVPYIEASEQTIIQKVVPFERQGRVFGFAQSVEMAASPLTAFLIGPVAQFIFIPFMTTGAGADLIGGWFGTGPDRGIALVFIITGIIGLGITLFAMGTKQYRLLSNQYTTAQ